MPLDRAPHPLVGSPDRGWASYLTDYLHLDLSLGLYRFYSDLLPSDCHRHSHLPVFACHNPSHAAGRQERNAVKQRVIGCPAAGMAFLN